MLHRVHTHTSNTAPEANGLGNSYSRQFTNGEPSFSGALLFHTPDHNEEHADVFPDEPAGAHLDPLGLDGGPQSLLAAHVVSSG